MYVLKSCCVSIILAQFTNKKYELISDLLIHLDTWLMWTQLLCDPCCRFGGTNIEVGTLL